MATAARKLSVSPRGAVVNSFVGNTGVRVVYTNAAAGDLTQLSTDKVLLVVDADSTDTHDRQKLVEMAEAAVYELKRQLFSKTTPAQTGTATVTTYRPL